MGGSKTVNIGARRDEHQAEDSSPAQVRALELRLREIEIQAQQAREAVRWPEAVQVYIRRIYVKASAGDIRADPFKPLIRRGPS